MYVYAIHGESIWRTDYNVAICSSKKLAENCIKEMNAEYNKWCEERNKNRYNSTDCLDFSYHNPQPRRYRIEKLKVFKK
jgi:Tfp pilus assembly pilus retraction ATPase PilT